MKYLIAILTALLLHSCKVNDYYQEAHETGSYQKHVVEYDSNLIRSYLMGRFIGSDSLSVMEVNSQKLEAATRNQSIWITALNPGCSGMYGSGGILEELNQLADTSGKPLLILSIHYQTELLSQIKENLKFETPFLVVSNADYGKRNTVFKRGWVRLFEDLMEQKYPKDCNHLLLRADGTCACLTYDGEFKEIK